MSPSRHQSIFMFLGQIRQDPDQFFCIPPDNLIRLHYNKRMTRIQDIAGTYSKMEVFSRSVTQDLLEGSYQAYNQMPALLNFFPYLLLRHVLQIRLLADFLRSNDAVPQLREAIIESIRTRAGETPEVITFAEAQLTAAVLGVREEYLATARRIIDVDYGGLTGYLESAGVTDDDVARARKSLLG